MPLLMPLVQIGKAFLNFISMAQEIERAAEAVWDRLQDTEEKLTINSLIINPLTLTLTLIPIPNSDK